MLPVAHLLDRLVDFGYAVAARTNEHSDYVRTTICVETVVGARWWAKLNYDHTLNLIGAAVDVACRRVRECVVRYGRERKQVTRRRIIEAAGRRFKTDGIDGSGIGRSCGQLVPGQDRLLGRPRQDRPDFGPPSL